MYATPNHQATTSQSPRPRRLDLWYRAGWRFNYIMLGAYGPAQLGGAGQPDPRELMRQERADRVLALNAGVPPARRTLR